ncbi:hypothetical protein STEG23_010621, partial [Scotinomys teguina]
VSCHRFCHRWLTKLLSPARMDWKWPPGRKLKEEPTLENFELFELLKTCDSPKPGRGNSAQLLTSSC